MARSLGFTLFLFGVVLLSGCGGGGASGGGSADTTPPAMVTSSPANSAADVPGAATLSVGFTEPMNTGSVTVTLAPSADLGPPSWSAGDTVVTYTPPTPLALGTNYAVTVIGSDVAGNPLPVSGWSFSTVAATVADNWDVASWDEGTWQ
jgi:hypothetical protein